MTHFGVILVLLGPAVGLVVASYPRGRKVDPVPESLTITPPEDAVPIESYPQIELQAEPVPATPIKPRYEPLRTVKARYRRRHRTTRDRVNEFVREELGN